MAGDDYISPLVILAPEKSRGSLVCKMLGQHPEMCPLLDTRLFARNEMYEWMDAFKDDWSSHGLVQCVAEFVFDGKSEHSLKQARCWLQQRVNRSTIDIFSELADLLYPLLIVERTAMITHRSQHMCRVKRHYPEARFLHVVLHPARSARSLVESFGKCFGEKATCTWREVIDPESVFCDLVDVSTQEPVLQPYKPWYQRHCEILKFLANIPKERQMMLRAEDLIAKPEPSLKAIVEWLGLRNDSIALKSMMQSQHDRFATDSASDPRPQPPPKWFVSRPTEVEKLARRFGYLQ